MGKMIFIPSLLQVLVLAGCGLFDGEPSVQLRAVPVSAVEMNLNIRTPAGQKVTLSRDGIPIAVFTPSLRDTFYIDSGLTPATAYTWQVRAGMETARARAATLDTTSSRFTWQRFEFGEYSSSKIQDVAIIDENNIWAVGEIYLYDPEGNPDFTPYNAVHWNGQEWAFHRIYYVQNDSEFIRPIPSIFAFNSNDIWFGNFTHWNGNEFESIPLNISFPSQINGFWGKSSEDLYIIGNSGLLAHYNGNTWQKLDSGTRAHFYDIYGALNDRSNRWEIIAVAADPTVSNNIAVVQIRRQVVSPLETDGIVPTIRSIWFVPGQKYLIGGGPFMHQNFLLGQSWSIDPHFNPARTEGKASIDGNGLNDIMVSGSFGLLKHFNGARWHHFEDLRIDQGAYGNVVFDGDLAVASGLDGSKGIVLIGRRDL